MYLDGSNVVVFSTIWYPYPFADQAMADMICAPMWCGYYYGNTTKVTVVDVSDLAAPRVAGEFYQPGSYGSSRRIGSSVRMVLSDSFRYPPGVRFYPDYTPELYQDHDLWVRALDALEAQNEKAIRAATIDQWLPHSLYRDQDGVVHDLGYSCTEFHKTNAPTRLGVVTVGTLDLSAAAIAANAGAPSMKRTSIIAEPGQIYASPTSLYVASGHWWWWPEPGQTDYTYLHKFDLTDPSNARYVASGGVEGHIVDQFAMDENADGFFRVATTIGTRVADATNPQNTWGTLQWTNRITVLGERAGALERVGQSEEIGKGETIRSARFIGDKGFVVTARSMDPFFTFDLSDPANPRPVGELQVPGFSSYLHPIDANTILALGVYTNPTGTWNERSIRLSLYDVSDFAHPREAHTQLVGTAYGWTEALWDHHAFNYFGAKKLLAIPFWDYNPTSTTGTYWDYYTSDLRVFSVDPVSGFAAKGALGMRDVYMSSTYNDWTWFWRPWVSRSVMADDYVFAISDAGIRVAGAASLSTPIATTLFDRAVVGSPTGPR
ncbi:MAG TPA: beta-propeller domain-containing protein [Myxococcales bacterium]|nr:beta-propeller domain-containing protein [Myxococcales bacterium]